MTFAVWDNFRGFVNSRPPLIIFMISLAAFAIALMTFAYIINKNEIPDPDVSEDWNTFLQSFSDVEFCVLSNSSDSVTDPSVMPQTAVPTKAAPSSLGRRVLPDISASEGYVNISVSMWVEMRPTADFIGVPHNMTLSATISGEDLGLIGDLAEMEMNVSFTWQVERNSSHCDENGRCRPIRNYTCLSFQAPASFFPITRRPQTCHPSAKETGAPYHVRFLGFRGMKTTHLRRKLFCTSLPTLHMTYKIDSTLTQMLSMSDKSIINLHLMHTSYFLFVMVVTLFCYAIVRGRPAKIKVVYHHAEKMTTKNLGPA